jgi:hypothetical protein
MDTETRIRILEADVKALEEAADSERAERIMLTRDLGTVTVILTKLIKKLDRERAGKA